MEAISVERLLESALKKAGLDSTFHQALSCPCIDSTSGYLKELLRQSPEPQSLQGACALSLEQTGGYGRQGRTWSSPVGGLYCSWVVPSTQQPAQNRSTLSLVTGLAVYDTLIQNGLTTAKIKWPNDILIGSSKVAGIALEGVREELVIGVGINVFRPTESISIPGKYTPAYVADYLQEKGISHELSSNTLSDSEILILKDLVAQLFSNFYKRFLAWDKRGFASFRSEYNSKICYHNLPVRLERVDGGLCVQGTCQGVSADGSLVLKTADGSLIPVSAGEVHIQSLPDS